MKKSTAAANCRRFTAIGYDSRENEVYVGCREAATQNVVFFPGDVQKFTQGMKNEDDVEFIDYSYENTATILESKFPTANIVIIVPKSMYQNTFSCFSNFTTCNTYGAVTTYDNTLCHACTHLCTILDYISSKVGLNVKLGLCLIGFSKGAVVLNQLVAELGVNDDDSQHHQLFANVCQMYWLDSGNGSLPGAFPKEFKTTSGFSINIQLHATAYQLSPTSGRPWIAAELEQFYNKLVVRHETLSVSINRHCNDLPAASIESHFKLLKQF